MNHDAYDSDYIRDILVGVKTIAVVGASSNPVRPSYFVLKYLTDKGFDAYAVNPGIAGQQLLGKTVVAKLADVPVPIDMVDVFRNSDAAMGVVEEALKLDPLPKVIWMQLGVRNDAAAAFAEAKGVRVVMNRCTKIEYGKHSGEWTWIGGNSGMISSQRLSRHDSGRMQSLGIDAGRRK
ncbi:MAG: CoA-binding protein [Hyphomicrobiales bacterium]